MLLRIVGPAIGMPFLTQTWVVIVASVFGTILVGESSIKGLLH